MSDVLLLENQMDRDVWGSTVNIYLAARYSRREEMEIIATLLLLEGFDITSRWVFGGEEGKTNEDIAILDLKDVDYADTVVSFSEPYGTMFKGGGRCVEFGYGLAKGKRCVLIGERENVFHWHPDVEQFNSLHEFINAENSKH